MNNEFEEHTCVRCLTKFKTKKLTKHFLNPLCAECCNSDIPSFETTNTGLRIVEKINNDRIYLREYKVAL